MTTLSFGARWGALALTYALLSGCHRTPAQIEFTDIPLAETGNPNKLTAIRGRVSEVQPQQRIVLYARSQTTWYVQPYANQPFTEIQADSTWKSAIHPGIEYAALLVGPDFRPVVTTGVLPTEGVIASAVTEGKPPVWRRWWFLTACGLLALFGAIMLHRFRLRQVANTLRIRFEERLAERTRVAQILHDTLLQGVISASMQLHVAVDHLPADSPALEPLRRAVKSINQVIEEGRNTLRALQSSGK